MYVIQNKLINYLLPFLLLPVIFSCSHFNEQPIDQSTTDLESVIIELPKLHSSTRLQFKNIESLHYVLKEISNDFNSVKKIDELGFISNRFKKYQLYKTRFIKTFRTEPNSESYRTYDIDDDDENDYFLDPITQSLVTDKNELMIGEMVFKYTEKGTFLYIDGNESDALSSLNSVSDDDIQNIYLTHDFNEEPVIEISSFLYYFGDPDFSLSNSSVPSNPDEGDGGSGGGGGAPTPPPPPTPINSHSFCNASSNISPVTQNYGHWTGGIRNTSYIYFGSSRRMKGKIWSTSYGTHATAGFFTKLQTRTLGIWWASDADKVSVSANGEVLYPNPNQDPAYVSLPFSPDSGGYVVKQNTNKSQLSFGIYTMVFKLKPNSSIPIIPTFKFAKRVKMKDVASCHYVLRGAYNGEIQFKISEN